MKAHDLWRQAALENRLQFFDRRYDPLRNDQCIDGDVEYSDGGKNYHSPEIMADCALTYLQARYRNTLSNYMKWECPECHIKRTTEVSSWMIHMNNVHRWDWLQFANKFPEFDKDG